jgi:hypothetical protein
MDVKVKLNEKRRNNNKSKALYGISRIDDDPSRSHALRFKLVRRGEIFVENFPDKSWGGKQKALMAAKQHRDKFLADNPPISRKEVCSIIGRNNTSGIAGVYRYAKSYTLKSGKLKKSWYWEATWPVGKSRQDHIAFAVNEHGETKARKLAISARKKTLRAVEGVYWASARGLA